MGRLAAMQTIQTMQTMQTMQTIYVSASSRMVYGVYSAQLYRLGAERLYYQYQPWIRIDAFPGGKGWRALIGPRG
jgi:hypothetical protein